MRTLIDELRPRVGEDWPNHWHRVQSVLASILEPSPAMIEAGVRALDGRQHHGTFRSDAKRVFEAMVASLTPNSDRKEKGDA